MVTVPYRYRLATLDDFGPEADPAREFVARCAAVEEQVSQELEWMEGSGFTGQQTERRQRRFHGVAGLVVVGPSGAGKTHLACAVALALPSHVRALVVEAADVGDDYREAARERRDPTAYHRFPGVLVLDDLSAIRHETTTDTERWLNARIIRHRYSEELPTVVTTHADHTHLCALYGEAVANRLLEMGAIVKLAGDDRRLRKVQA
jgi:DNA replication protein DnaC